MNHLVLGTVLVTSLVSVGSAQASESFLFGAVKPGQPVKEAVGSDPDGGTEHPNTSDTLIFGAIGAKADPFFATLNREPVASKELAVQEAWKDCENNHVKCDEVVWFQYGCAAVARGSNVAKAGVSVMATLAEVRKDAVNQCAKAGGQNCKVQETFCAPKELN